MDFYRLFCAYIGMCSTLLNLSKINILMQFEHGFIRVFFSKRLIEIKIEGIWFLFLGVISSLMYLLN